MSKIISNTKIISRKERKLIELLLYDYYIYSIYNQFDIIEILDPIINKRSVFFIFQ